MTDPNVSGRSVRPYAITGGRAGHEIPHIALEALVRSTADGWSRRDEFRFESAEIVLLAVEPTAIVELAAMLEVPVGVVRVLASDLARAGAVSVTAPDHDHAESDKESYANLLRQVLDGIKSV